MLVIPGILTSDSSLIEKSGTLEMPALQRLLAKARRDTRSWQGIEEWLFESFQIERQTDWPSAPFALLGEGISPGDACWAHADPVSLRADRDRLLLADAALLNIQLEEAQAISASFAAHFGDALELRIGSPDRWYLRLDTPPQGRSIPLSAVAGRSIQPGSGAMGWHALMNEMQMLLYEHPVNQAREARGEAPINGVWLWGAGRLAPAETRFHSVTAALPLARGLAQHAGIAAFAPPERATPWIQSVSTDGIHVCVHDALARAAARASMDAWLETLARMERDWFAPLHDALAAGHIDMLTLSLGGSRTLDSYEAIRQDLRRFWRRPKPLSRTLAVVNNDENQSGDEAT
jgi:hypothetical protein